MDWAFSRSQYLPALLSRRLTSTRLALSTAPLPGACFAVLSLRYCILVAGVDPALSQRNHRLARSTWRDSPLRKPQIGRARPTAKGPAQTAGRA